MSTPTPSPTLTPSPTPSLTPSPTPPLAPVTSSATSREFGRTIILVLGGVSWSDWMALASQSSTATPGLRRVLEEGALGAAFLPGAHDRKLGKDRAHQNLISGAMLRAALILSSGDENNARRVPDAAAFTFGLRESPGAGVAGYEEGEAAVTFARRTDRAPQPGNLVNLGWGALLQSTPSLREDDAQISSLGGLAEAAHLAGGKTAALGAGDATISLQQSTPLREWALLACDSNGMVDAGDVSSRLLARDKAAPFGVRANRKSYLQTLDMVFATGQTALVAIEWGDTRRAAEYSSFCAPDVAASHRQAALRSADAFVQELIGGSRTSTTVTRPATTTLDASTMITRLNASRDRLLIIAVPDLHEPHPQWLPVAYWRPGRGGQGALLEKTQDSEGLGAVGLENLYSRLVAPLGVGSESTMPPSLRERGVPRKASERISKLIALQSGLSWLERARNFSHASWCTIFILACGFTLWALRHERSARAAKWARGLWCAAMIFPWLLWLAGLCVETTWRFGNTAFGEGGVNWKLALALLLVACLMWFLIGASFNWFGHAKLQRIRIGIIWFLLSILGLKIGGFLLPWNALLHLAPDSASTPAARAGEVWSLLLISATLLAIAGLTRAPRAVVSSSESGVSNSEPETRRVLNLRPSLIWIVALIVILWLDSWGRDVTAATLAFIAAGAMWLRLWLEREKREVRMRNRRIVFIVVAIGVLLLWQRGGLVGWQESFEVWRGGWQVSWHAAWWNLSFAALLALVFALVFGNAREVLRKYLAPRYSLRAMLGATAFASLVGLIIYGPAAPPLLATFTFGALAHEVLGAESKPAESRA